MSGFHAQDQDSAPNINKGHGENRSRVTNDARQRLHLHWRCNVTQFWFWFFLCFSLVWHRSDLLLDNEGRKKTHAFRYSEIGYRPQFRRGNNSDPYRMCVKGVFLMSHPWRHQICKHLAYFGHVNSEHVVNKWDARRRSGGKSSAVVSSGHMPSQSLGRVEEEIIAADVYNFSDSELQSKKILNQEANLINQDFLCNQSQKWHIDIFQCECFFKWCRRSVSQILKWVSDNGTFSAPLNCVEVLIICTSVLQWSNSNSSSSSTYHKGQPAAQHHWKYVLMFI